MTMLEALNAPTSDWVKKTLDSLTLEEKIGQLIFSRTYMPDIADSIKSGIVGNILVPTHTPPEKIAEYQKAAKVPLMICADLENGGIYGKINWPNALCLAGLPDDTDLKEAAYKWAYYQGLQSRENGINSVFGPVFDIAMNPKSTASGTRTLGATPQKVTEMAASVIKGFQASGLLPFAKHFPGFGRGEQDAHMELSLIEVDKDTIFAEDILPYIEAVNEAGLAGVMTGHIIVPEVDSELPLPLSPKIFNLLDEIGFKGLTVTDSLAMKGLTMEYSAYDRYVKSLAIGHDMLITDYFVRDSEGVNLIKQGIENSDFSEEALSQRVERVLKMKEYLLNFKPAAYNTSDCEKFYYKVALDSISGQAKDYSYLSTEDEVLFVLVSDEMEQVAGEVTFGTNDSDNIKENITNIFPKAVIEALPAFPGSRAIEMLLHKSKSYENVCFIIKTECRAYAGINSFSKPVLSLISALRKKIHTLVSVGNPYSIKELPEINQVLVSCGGGAWAKALLNVLSGSDSPKGKLPIE
jgi:beta-N-acetylhexosaminidase